MSSTLDHMASLARQFSKAVQLVLHHTPEADALFEETLQKNPETRAERDELFRREWDRTLDAAGYIRLAEIDARTFIAAGGDAETLKGFLPLRARREIISAKLKDTAPVLSFICQPHLKLVA